MAAEAQWKLPLKWNKAAEEAGERHRVFCASLADVFEGRETMPEASWEAVETARLRLFNLIHQTPHLDWLLLTKRPQNVILQLQECRNIRRQAPDRYSLGGHDLEFWLHKWISGYPPENVWLGTSVENQEAADKRIPALLGIPAKVRFLSCEPLLAPVDLRAWMDGEICNGCKRWLTGADKTDICDRCGEEFGDCGESPSGFNCECIHCRNNIYSQECNYCGYGVSMEDGPGVDWVICGFESGTKARPGHPDWARSLRDQCNAAGVKFLFKQWGEWMPAEDLPDDVGGRGIQFVGDDCYPMTLVGKKNSGRLLDGREWNEVPEVRK